LDETTILVDMILYLSLYYLVNDLIHLPNPHIKMSNLVESFVDIQVSKEASEPNQTPESDDIPKSLEDNPSP